MTKWRVFELWIFQHPQFLIAVAILVPLLAFAFYFYDRDPPALVGVPDPVPSVRAGEELLLDLPIERDLSRVCTLELTRYVRDSSKALTTLTDHQRVNAASVRGRDAASPNRLILRLPIPSTIPSGPAVILTDAAFTCIKNPTTWLVPIEVSWEWPIVVLPKLVEREIVIIQGPG